MTKVKQVCGSCGGNHAYYDCPILARAIAENPSLAAEAEFNLWKESITIGKSLGHP